MRRAGDGRWRFFCYVSAVIALGAGVLVVSVLHLDRPFAGANPTAFWIYAACAVVCELNQVRLLRNDEGEYTATWTFAVALLLSAPLASGVLIMLVASLIGDLVSRKTPVQIAFNASNLIVCMVVGAGFLGLIADGQPLMDPGGQLWPYLPLAMVAGMIVYGGNSVVTMIVLALHKQIAVWPLVRRGFSVNLSTDGMLLALAPVFVVVAERSAILLPLLLLTAWAIYDSASKALARQHEALHDALTDLPNRRLFDQQVSYALAEAEKRGWKLAIMIVDLDGFKEINDRLGHHVGDAVLKVVAERFQGQVRNRDLVARLGGDEFAVLLHHIRDQEQAVARAGDLLRALEQPCVIQEFPLRVSGSFGVALYPDHAESADDLLQVADRAMYHAKARRLGISVFAGERDQQGLGRVSLLGELRKAIDLEALYVHYQPVLRVADDVVIGVEALVRWDHPVRGAISAGDFMPLAEQTDLMPRLTEFVLRTALTQGARWRAAGLDLRMAVNGSAKNLVDPRFVALVERVLRETGVPASGLEIELTENTVMVDPYRTSETLSALRAMGVTISIDDFGTGYSSITNLRDLPIDRVKLDRSFVTSMVTQPRDAHIVGTILELARGLEIDTVAEGVESIEVLEALAALGCQHIQGFLVSRPCSGPELTSWLEARVATADIEVAS